MKTSGNAETEAALLETVFAANTAPRVRQIYPTIGLPLLGVWVETYDPAGDFDVHRVLACANLPGAHEMLSNHGRAMVENRIATSWSIREFRIQPPDRRHQRALRHWQNAEERIIELGY